MTSRADSFSRLENSRYGTVVDACMWSRTTESCYNGTQGWVRSAVLRRATGLRRAVGSGRRKTALDSVAYASVGSRTVS